MEKEKTKLCPQCEGRLPLESEECLYCGHDIYSELKKTNYSYLEQESFDFMPPYSAEDQPASPSSAKESQTDVKTKQYVKKQQSILFTILLLSIGSYLFTLGLIVFFFAQDGRLILEWKSRYSLLYCLVAAPFLYIGWLRLKNE